MLKIFYTFHEMDISQLYSVCIQSNTEAGMGKYPDYSEYDRLKLAEDDMKDYFRFFLNDPKTFVAVWEEADKIVSVLRAEEYRDGILVSGLETAPGFRNRGIAASLLSAVAGHLAESGFNCVYSHVDKRNAVSLRVHDKCGFSQCWDCAVLLDGTVTTGMYTLCKKL